MSRPRKILALDVGERRIGVAQGDSTIRIAVPGETILRDGTELQSIQKLITDNGIDLIVVGYPRNQSGETTQQTVYVEDFVAQLNGLGLSVSYQDESLTSVLAEKHLKNSGKPYSKADIDALAASIILEDYLEENT